jgi:Lon protease-like protein
MANQEVPLFPLQTVLFPGGPLPLRIFEARYVDMISRCMREGSEFGVLLISDGAETGPSTVAQIGTLARITDWYQGSDGLLGVTAQGTERFRLLGEHAQPDGLRLGDVERLPRETDADVPDAFSPLASILENVLDNLGKHYADLERHYDSATWIGYRFAEILPLSLPQRQYFLEIEDPIARLELVATLLKQVREDA